VACAEDSEVIPLPQWITGEIREAWDEYVSLRIRDKKAMTPRSMVARVKRLQALKDAGHDPLQCLDEAINGHWLDFYAPREKSIEINPSSQAERTAEELRKRDERGFTAPPPELREIANKIRRVS
jgi:hypothetical protein